MREWGGVRGVLTEGLAWSLGAFRCLAGAALESVVLLGFFGVSSVMFLGPTLSLHLGSGSLFSASQAAAFIWLTGGGRVGAGRGYVGSIKWSGYF